MLEIFVGPCPIGMEACHNNGKANDNILGNIRWDTHSKNILDKNLHGTGQQGEQNNRAKLKNKDIVIIKDMFQRGMTRKEIAEIFHVHRYTISRVLQGKTYAVLGMGTAVTINPSAK